MAASTRSRLNEARQAANLDEGVIIEEHRLAFKHEWSLETIRALARYQERYECPNCDGTGINIEDVAAILVPDVGLLVAGSPTECECCSGLGWQYGVNLN